MEKFSDRQIQIMDAATSRIDGYGIQNLTIKNLAADVGLSQPALYRHFKSKNDILLGVLNYFIAGMKSRISQFSLENHSSSSDGLRALFNSQLQTFIQKPAIVSVIFAESIFHFVNSLSVKVFEIMDLMHQYVLTNIEKGQIEGFYNATIPASTLTTILLGAMRMTVLKWKIAGHHTDLMHDGKETLEGILTMIERK